MAPKCFTCKNTRMNLALFFFLTKIKLLKKITQIQNKTTQSRESCPRYTVVLERFSIKLE